MKTTKWAAKVSNIQIQESRSQLELRICEPINSHADGKQGCEKSASESTSKITS
jgi:hypothetical protein